MTPVLRKAGLCPAPCSAMCSHTEMPAGAGKQRHPSAWALQSKSAQVPCGAILCCPLCVQTQPGPLHTRMPSWLLDIVLSVLIEAMVDAENAMSHGETAAKRLQWLRSMLPGLSSSELVPSPVTSTVLCKAGT